MKDLIIATLRDGGKVEVLIARPEPTEWKVLPVLTAPSLEAGLIRMIRPK